MEISRPKIPVVLLVISVILLILGLLAGPFINSRATPEQLADNVLLNAIPFVLIFVSILLLFISVIVIVGSMLNHNVPPRIYKIIESILIAGIVLGVLGMFQPWVFAAYKYGFILLLVSLLLFMVWSHVAPRSELVQDLQVLREIRGGNMHSVRVGRCVGDAVIAENDGTRPPAAPKPAGRTPRELATGNPHGRSPAEARRRAAASSARRGP